MKNNKLFTMKSSKEKSTNSGDNINAGNGKWTFSGEMVNHFEEHVKKSVPIYSAVSYTHLTLPTNREV